MTASDAKLPPRFAIPPNSPGWVKSTAEFLESSWGRRIVNWGVLLVATILCALTLTKFSGTALLFPESWHEIVTTTGSLVGIIAFELGRSSRERWYKKHRKHRKAEQDAQAPEHRGISLLDCGIWGSLLVLILSLACFFVLRGRCVRYFDPTLWLTQQAKLDAFLPIYHPKSTNEIDRATANGPTTEDLKTQKAMSDAAEEVVKSADQPGKSTHKVPEFIDVDARLIYLPIHFPEDHQKYFDDLSSRGEDGVTTVLDKYPGMMVNWLNGDTRMYLNHTTLLFLLNYLMVLFSAALLAGLRFEPVNGILEALCKIG